MTGQLVFIILLTSRALLAPAYGDKNERWLDRNKEGWFYYQEETEPPEEEKKEPPSPPPVPPPMAKSANVQESGPAPLSSAWIRQNIQLYLDSAIDHPTVENVSAYLYLQKYAMDKSFAFMDANQKATMGHTDFDAINIRPTATFANRQLDDEASHNSDRVLTRISQYSGLFFFTDDSEFSRIQTGIINMLSRNYAFDIVTISTKALTSDQLDAGIKQDAGHSKMMGVATYPAIVLVKEDGHFDVISQAPVSYSDLRKRLLIGANRLGLVNDDEYNTTRTARNLEQKTLDLSSLKNNPDTSSTVPVSQSEIIQVFRRAYSP